MSIANVLAIVAKTRQRVAGVSVRYRRGDLCLCFKATPGRTPLESVQTDGTVLRYETRDFIFPAELLELESGERFEPQDTDRIDEEVTPGEWREHKALPIANGQCFRYTDQHRQEIRVHAQRQT